MVDDVVDPKTWLVEAIRNIVWEELQQTKQLAIHNEEIRKLIRIELNNYLESEVRHLVQEEVGISSRLLRSELSSISDTYFKEHISNELHKEEIQEIVKELIPEIEKSIISRVDYLFSFIIKNLGDSIFKYYKNEKLEIMSMKEESFKDGVKDLVLSIFNELSEKSQKSE